MPCTNCGSDSPIIFTQSFNSSPCIDCGNTPCSPTSGICYSGPNLTCSGIINGDTLDNALSKIDEKICSASGNYTSYQKNCLETWFGGPINNEADFVNGITGYACSINSNLTTFIGTTFTNFKSTTTSSINNISTPSLICASAGITSSDNILSIISKYCAKFTSLDILLTLPGVTWNTCFTSSNPTNIIAGFNEVLNQICQVKSLVSAGGSSFVLPTFNNTGSCLATPGTTDLLVDTIEKLKTRVCLSPTYLSSNVTWGCTGTPSITTLEGSLQQIVNKVNILLPKQVTFGSGFTVLPVDGGNPCLGVTVTASAGTDRLVAATSGDITPGTLSDKLLGNGITIDSSTTPGKITIVNDHKLLASSADSVADFLINKINGSSNNGISVTPVYNTVSKKVDLNLLVDIPTLCAALANCNITCSSYLVTPSTPSLLSYTSCNGSVVSSTISGATTVCARVNTVYAPSSTIVNTGSCSTPPANFTLNSSYNYSIDSATGTGVPSLASTGINGTISGHHTIISGNIPVTISATTPPANAYIALTKNGIQIQCINITTGPGTYTFTSISAIETDIVQIYINVGTCAAP